MTERTEREIQADLDEELNEEEQLAIDEARSILGEAQKRLLVVGGDLDHQVQQVVLAAAVVHEHDDDVRSFRPRDERGLRVSELAAQKQLARLNLTLETVIAITEGIPFLNAICAHPLLMAPWLAVKALYHATNWKIWPIFEIKWLTWISVKPVKQCVECITQRVRTI